MKPIQFYQRTKKQEKREEKGREERYDKPRRKNCQYQISGAPRRATNIPTSCRLKLLPRIIMDKSRIPVFTQFKIN